MGAFERDVHARSSFHLLPVRRIRRTRLFSAVPLLPAPQGRADEAGERWVLYDGRPRYSSHNRRAADAAETGDRTDRRVLLRGTIGPRPGPVQGKILGALREEMERRNRAFRGQKERSESAAIKHRLPGRFAGSQAAKDLCPRRADSKPEHGGLQNRKREKGRGAQARQ